MDGGTIAAISVAVVSLVGTVVSAIANRKKIGAESTQSLTSSYSTFTADVRRDNEQLRSERAQDKIALADLHAKLEKIEQRLDDEVANRVRLEAEQAQTKAELATAESKIDELEAREEARDVLSRKHREWDELAVHLVRSAIPPIHLTPPPPLDVDEVPPAVDPPTQEKG